MGAYKTCVVVNPFSGRGRLSKLWPQLEKKLKANIGDFTIFTSLYPHHPTILTRTALISGYDRIIAVGGDGTLSQVVNGFFSEERHKKLLNEHAVLGLLNTGTGCDTSRSLFQDNSIDAQIAVLKSGAIKKIDLGKVETWHNTGEVREQFFINACSFGLTSEVVVEVNKGGRLQAMLGRFGYIVSAIKPLLKRRNIALQMEIDGRPSFVGEVALVAVLNGAFCGGGIHLAPMAKLDDGQFDAIIVGDVGFKDLLFYAKKLFKGQHLDHPEIHHQSLKKTFVKTTNPKQAPVTVEADGEEIGFLPATIEIVPQILNVQVAAD